MDIKKLTLQSMYGRNPVKCIMFYYDDGTVALTFGFLESVELQLTLHPDSARQLAENILAIVPASAEAEAS